MDARFARLLRIGDAQVIELPPGLELAGERVTVREANGGLIIEAEPQTETLAALFARMDTIDEPWPEIDDPPPEPVNL